MKKNRLCRGMILMVLLVAVLAGCGGGGPKDSPSGGLSSFTYGGADAKGDHIAITINGKASTLTITNYTVNMSKGPYSFSRVTDPARNGGYQNLYRTQNLSDDSKNRYAQFVIANGAAILFQIFEDDKPDGTPWFAFSRREVSNLLNVYKETAYNWVNFKMDLEGTESNSEAGFLAIDSDNNGAWYGAGYNHQEYVYKTPGYDNGVHDISNGQIKTIDFRYNSSIVANTMAGTDGIATLISTHNNDFIMDLGENKGAYYMIRQAKTEDWQSVYNGTYFMLVYESVAQSITSMKLVLREKNYQISQGGESILSGPLSNVRQGGPGVKILTELFRTQSNLSGAESSIISNAYNCHGSFIGGDINGFNDSVLYMIVDPNGRYLCVTIAKNTGSGYDYWFGFGVKG